MRKRKAGMALTPLERDAERWYDAQRRRCRVQVYLNSPDEVREWKLRAKKDGFSSVGTWIAHACRTVLEEEGRLTTALEESRRRADRAEAEVRSLRRRLELLERAMGGGENGPCS